MLTLIQSVTKKKGSLLDSCSRFDVAMAPTALARHGCHKMRHGLGQVPVDKTIDFWTHETWTTLMVDILHCTHAG